MMMETDEHQLQQQQQHHQQQQQQEQDGQVMTLSTGDGTEVQLADSAVNEMHQQQQQQQQQQHMALSASGSLITSMPSTLNQAAAMMTFTDSNKGWDMLEFHRKAR
jgi:hypothetical protein